ncbi:hypothetical protein [Streptomyces flavofungini]|uniref:hypothetical protein n=1 Tax=Streptomyces flavofungini TaxID=68200 RepID=UPI0034DE1D4F
MRDRWGFDVSTDAAGMRLWDAAVDARLREAPDAADAAQAVLAHDPRLGVARALAATTTSRATTMSRDRLDTDATAQSRELRRAFHDGVSASGRESSLIQVLHLRAQRRTAELADHLVEHLALYPADPLALRLVYSTCLASTDPARRAWSADLIERQAAAAPRDSWPTMAALAFLRAEQHRCQEAAALAHQALDIEPACTPAAHVLLHVHHDTGAAAAGLSLVETWLTKHPHTPRRHFRWHAALHALATGDLTRARHWTAKEFTAQDVAARSSLNWRLHLTGQDPAAPLSAEDARALLADEDRAMATVWNAFHIALALAVAGDAEGLDRLARHARRRNRPAYADVLAPAVDALALLLRGQPGQAAGLLAGLRHRVWLLGLTRPEAEILEDTLARALSADDRPDEAAELLHHRMDTRTTHAYERMLCTALS